MTNRKSRKIRSLINKIDNLSDENLEEKNAISYQINEKINSLRKGGNKKRKTRKNRKKKGVNCCFLSCRVFIIYVS